MHTPTRTACRPLSSLALMAALGVLPLAAAAQQGTPAANAPASVAPQTAGQPVSLAASQNVAQPGSQAPSQGIVPSSGASPAAASATPSASAPPSAASSTTPSAAGSQAAGQPASAVQPAASGQPAAPGQTAPSGQPTASGQPATPPAPPQAAPQPAGSAQPAPSPAASNTPPARLPSTGTPPTQPANSANRLPAAPDTADTAKQARNCYVPDDLLSEPGRLPGLSAALVRGKGDLLVIMLGSESTNPSPARPASVPSNTANSDAGGSVSSRLRATLAAAARNPLAERLEERLIQDLGPLPGRTVHVESVGRRNSTVAEQASLIGKQILPRKPALVIWNLGRTDTRRGLPPANMARALDRGLEQLRRQHIDTIVMDPPYHPQFEAFYRTDDYRQYIRWTMNLHDQPYLHRYDMIDYWASTGRIDLDSGEPDRQAAAVTFTETCIAYQLSRMIDRGLSRK